MSSTTRAAGPGRPRAPRPTSRSCWKVSSRPCARATHGVASTGEVSTPRPSRWNHGPIVGPNSPTSSLRVGGRQVGHGLDAERRQAGRRSWRRRPTARASGGRPSRRPGLVGDRVDVPRRWACRSRWRSWPAACCCRCRPSSAAGSRSSTADAQDHRHLPRVAEVAVTLARAEEGLVPAEHLEHDGYAAPLEVTERRHHLRRGREVVRRVDGQEHRIGALLVRRPQRHAGPDAELARLVRRRRDHRALVDDAAAADHDRLAGQLRACAGSRLPPGTCRGRRGAPIAVPCQVRSGGGGSASVRLELVEPGEQQQVGDHRPDLRQQHVGVEVGGPLDPSRSRRRRRAARAGRRRPSGRPSTRGDTTVGRVGEVAAQHGRTTRAPAGAGRR